MFISFQVLTTFPTIPVVIGIQIGSTPFAAFDQSCPFSSSTINTEARSHSKMSHTSSTIWYKASWTPICLEILWQLWINFDYRNMMWVSQVQSFHIDFKVEKSSSSQYSEQDLISAQNISDFYKIRLTLTTLFEFSISVISSIV